MNDDFEFRLATLLTEQVDYETGARRPAPPFEPRARRRPPWLVPLLAAACVLAVVGTGVGVGATLADNDTGPAVGPTNPPSTPPTTTYSVQGAKIVVPHGWRLSVDDDEPHGGDFDVASYCIRPADVPDARCIQLGRITPAKRITGDSYANLDVDATAWGQGNGPQYICGSGQASVTEKASTVTFGGRPADYRRWTRSCHGTVVAQEVQYVVTTAPAWGLSLVDPSAVKGHSAADYLATVREIASRSQLPPATGTVRYMDRGLITAVSHTGADVRMTLRRQQQVHVRDGSSRYVTNTPATATYTAPLALYDRARVSVHQRVLVLTNGSIAIYVSHDPAG